MDDVIKRLQDLVKATGFDVATLGCSAAAQGDLTVMESLYRSFGAQAFVSNAGASKTAYDYAAAGNQVGVLRWLVDKQILPPLSESTGDSAQHLRDAEAVKCGIAFVAMEHGAFEALEFIADQMPRLRQLPVHGVHSGIDFPAEGGREYERSHRIMVVRGEEQYSFKPSYAGLMAGCIAAAQIRGRDIGPMLATLDRHLATAPRPLASDVKIALHLDRFDVAERLLNAGARIDIFKFYNRLKEARRPISVLTFMADYMQATGKSYDDIVEPMNIGGFGSEKVLLDSYEKFLSTADAFGPFLYQTVHQIREVASKLQEKPSPDSGDVAKLPVEMFRFASLLAPEAVGTAMMRVAVERGQVEFVEEMLKAGVNPNAYGTDIRSRTHDKERGMLPVHLCDWKDMLRLLHRYGADVNLPVEGNDNVNLLQIICTSSMERYDEDFLPVFAECGGDFARKFDGKTAASLAKKKGEDFYKTFMAVKTSTAVTRSFDSQKGEVDANPSRAPRVSPL